MNRELLTYIASFVALILFQVLVLSNLHISFYLSPMIYPLFILLLPFNMRTSAIMLVAFFMGLIIDGFNNTGGTNAAALVLMAFSRSSILSLLTPRMGYDTADYANIHSLGVGWFLGYAGILLLLHHILYFFLETFSLFNFFNTLGRIGLSSVATLILVVILALIFTARKKRI